MLVVCLFSPFVACSNHSAEQQNEVRGSPAPSGPPESVASSGTDTRLATAASEPAEHTVVENTVGGAILRRDESVLNIVQARLLRAKENDEIFVKARVEKPAEARDCYLMKASTWFDLRDAIESENISDAPDLLETPWADPASTTRFSGGDTLAISFQENIDQKIKGPDTEDTSFFDECYKIVDLESNVTWYDVAHVEGTPETP
jgi:hypothetical protein